MPLPAMLRRVSGRKRTIKKRVRVPKMKRNQNIAWKPRNWAMIPPRTGPKDWPLIRTVILSAKFGVSRMEVAYFPS